MHAWHWDISSFFRLVCVNILLISYDYYQFLEGCQSGVVERFAVPDQAAPNFVMYFTVYGLWHRSDRNFGGCSCVGYCVSSVEFAILSDWCLLALMWSMDIHVITVDVPWWLRCNYQYHLRPRMIAVVTQLFLRETYFHHIYVVGSSLRTGHSQDTRGSCVWG